MREREHGEKTASKTAGRGAREGERKRGEGGGKGGERVVSFCCAADGFLQTFAAGVGR